MSDPTDGGNFGRWEREAAGDWFALDDDPGSDAVLPVGGLAECWHQVGNAEVTATAHAGGWTTLWSTRRGMVQLTGASNGWGLVRDGETVLGGGSLTAANRPATAPTTPPTPATSTTPTTQGTPTTPTAPTAPTTPTTPTTQGTPATPTTPTTPTTPATPTKAPEGPAGELEHRPAPARAAATGSPRPRVSWGASAARWTTEASRWRCVRQVTAPFDDVAALRIDVHLERTDAAGPHPDADGRGGAALWWEERWPVEPRHLLVGGLMARYRPPPAGYTVRDAAAWRLTYAAAAVSRRATDLVRRVASRGLYRPPVAWSGRAVIAHPPRWPPVGGPAAPAWVDRRLPWVAVALVEGSADGSPIRTVVPARTMARQHGDASGRSSAGPSGRSSAGPSGRSSGGPPDAPSWACDLTTSSLRIAVPDGRRVELSFVVAAVDSLADLPAVVRRAGACDPELAVRRWSTLLRLDLSPTIDHTRAPPEARAGSPEEQGAPMTPPGAAVSATSLEREVRWHACQLVGARQHDAHFDATYVTQGSAYGFVHGLQGAPRDYAFSAVPLAFVDPPAARDLVRVMMMMTSSRGVLQYAHCGRGMCTSGGIHAAPTDLGLFLLWAITEYVWATGDRDFLDASVPFWHRRSPPGSRPPRGSAGRAPTSSSTVRQRILLAWTDLAERIGTGDRGLVRVGSGDWNDPISAMVADRSAFHRHGESGFNTSFAAWVLPRAAALVEATHPRDAADMRAWAAERREAMSEAWNGRWFLRGTDGHGGPVGDDHLFLDAQVWALIAECGTAEQRERTVEEIRRRCGRPSPIGATILDRPHPVRLGMLAPGWDCNGGVWAAINALWAWAEATVDPPGAWRTLERQSLAAHARAYPQVWFGIWSGPDAYNSHHGEAPGETFVQPATPMAEYPTMNSNAHAGPLLATLRVLGVETGPEGPGVAPRPGLGSWRLETALGVFEAAR